MFQKHLAKKPKKYFPEVQEEMLCYTKNVQLEEDMKCESNGTGNEEKDQLIKIVMAFFNYVFWYMTRPVIQLSP